MERTQPHQTDANFSIEEYGAKTAEKEECEEQLLTEYATLLGFYLTSAAVLTGIALQQDRLPRKFGLLDLALLGIATHKLIRIVAKDRITGILRAPFVCYIRSAGAGETDSGAPAEHREARRSCRQLCTNYPRGPPDPGRYRREPSVQRAQPVHHGGRRHVRPRCGITRREAHPRAR